jgi:hypothetical protein
VTSGPEHYQAGEDLLDEASEQFPRDERAALYLVARAQAHFTAALAAATALRVTTPEGMGREDKQAWREVAATPQKPVEAVA